MVPINVGTLQDYIDMGRLNIPDVKDHNDPPLTMKDLVQAGITKTSSIKHGIKLLAKGKERLRSPIKIEISRASAGAIEAIEKAGGEITTVHYNRLALRALLKPEKFEVIPKRARPPPKLMQYYTDYDKRGYLSPEVQFKKVEQMLGGSDTDTSKEN
jgi:large subunit ribosomal protein L15